MTRMTNWLKEKIVESALAKTDLSKRRKAWQKDRYDLAEKFRVESLGGAEQCAKIEALCKSIEQQIIGVPEDVRGNFGFRYHYQMYRMNLAGMRVNLDFSGTGAASRLAPYSATFTASHPLVEEFLQSENVGREIDADEEAIKRKVGALLNTCTTVKRLLDVWPEAKELLPAKLQESKTQLPMVQTSELNSIIGLPAGEKE